MKIVVVTETLHPGGAETFVLRLVNALVANDEVTLINLYPDLSSTEMMKLIDMDVKVVNVSIGFRTLWTKIDGLLFRCNVDFSIIEWLFCNALRKQIEACQPDVVHSHLFKTDYYVSKISGKAFRKFNHVMTNHGDYLLYETRKPVRMLRYKEKLQKVLTSLDHCVVISDQQLRWMEKKKESGGFLYSIHKILNGYSADSISRENSIRSELQLSDKDFVFGMVSRGIREKGWHDAIRAFQMVNVPHKKLILVGDGDEIKLLKDIYGVNRDIFFLGYIPVPVSCIRAFDVCIFPSYYKAESLPTVIIEYLYCMKPIITTDIGEVRNMLGAKNGAVAGIFVKHSETAVDVRDLSEKMHFLYSDEGARSTLRMLTKSAIEKFSMKTCVESYLEVYRKKRSENVEP